MKVLSILEASEKGAIEKTLDAVDTVSDIYMAGSVAASIATGGAASPSMLVGLASKAAVKGARNAILKRVSGRLAKGASAQITKSASKRLSMGSIRDAILSAVHGDTKKNSEKTPEEKAEYLKGDMGTAGSITHIGILKGASPVSIKTTQSGIRLVTWSFLLDSNKVMVTVATDNKNIYVPPSRDINAKAVFNSCEIPLYKLASILQGIFNPKDPDINKKYKIAEIGKHIIGMDRSWLVDANDYEV